MDREAALLQQQQRALAHPQQQQQRVMDQQQQQQQMQQNMQAQAGGAAPNFNISLAALLAQQQPGQQPGQAQQQQQQQQGLQGGFGAPPMPLPAAFAGQQGFMQGYSLPGMAALGSVPQSGALGVPQQQATGTFVGAEAQLPMPNFLGALPDLSAAGGGGTGTLPPAILQHQQAALARQQQAAAAAAAAAALPGLQMPFLVPVAPTGAQGSAQQAQQSQQQQSQQQQQQQMNWAALGQQAAGGLPMMGLPGLLSFPGMQQPAASAVQQQQQVPMQGMVGCGAGQQQQQQQQQGSGGDQGAVKRRGRQPKDPSSLSEKQLRAREAQKRFRDKQKKVMAQTEDAVGETQAELERLRVSNESQKLKNEVLERLLQYKEAQVHALEFQKQMDPPPRFTISADMVDMMRREGIAGLFTPEVLLRYSVAGHREHMDAQGEVKVPPPFDKVAEDWKTMVVQVKEILDAARQSSSYAPQPGAAATAAAAGATAPCAALPVLAPAAPLPGSVEIVELQGSGSTGAAGASVGGIGSTVGRDPAAAAAAAAAASTGHTGGQRLRGALEEVGRPEGPQRLSFDDPTSLGSAPAAARAAASGDGAVGMSGIENAASGSGEALPAPEALAAAAAAAAAGSGGSGSAPATSGAGSGGSGRRASPVARVPDDVLPEVAAIAEEAPDDVLEAAEAKDDPIARFVLARILSQTAAHSHLQWDSLVEGAAVQDGPDLYRFTGKQLRTLAHLMRRVGLMLWQQALLFPQHITKLGCLRLDDPNNLHVEQQNEEHWRAILRRLHCRPEQLHKIVAGHQRYMARMQPVLEERQEALEIVKSITQYQVEHAWQPQASTSSFVAGTTRLTEATGLVMQTVSAQHAAYCELLIAIFYALTFPVQRPQLFVLSWPYFPQLQLLGRAAALELGLDISAYPTYSADVSV